MKYYITLSKSGYSIINHYEFRTKRFTGVVYSEHKTWYDVVYTLEELEK